MAEQDAPVPQAAAPSGWRAVRLTAMLATLLVIGMCVLTNALLGPPDFPQGIANVPGSRDSPSGRYELSVRLVERLVYYKVIDRHLNNAVVVEGGGFSNFHRWFFYWDDSEQLWCDNSDMGPFCLWAPDEAGIWQRIRINRDTPLVEAVPQPVLDHLSTGRLKMLREHQAARALQVQVTSHDDTESLD